MPGYKYLLCTIYLCLPPYPFADWLAAGDSIYNTTVNYRDCECASGITGYLLNKSNWIQRVLLVAEGVALCVSDGMVRGISASVIQ